jgi:hypothetical protein
MHWLAKNGHKIFDSSIFATSALRFELANETRRDLPDMETVGLACVRYGLALLTAIRFWTLNA